MIRKTILAVVTIFVANGSVKKLVLAAIVSGVFLMVQQRLMPMGNMDPMQQKMMRIMPIGFGIFMFTFPAGLALYFSVNNSLTILQQWFIYRKKDDEVSVPAKA